MNKPAKALSDSHRARSSSGLLRGMAAAWMAVVGLVAACVLLGMNWAFQRNANGLPTPVLSTSSSNQAATDTTPQPTSSLPTPLPTLAARPAAAAGAVEPTLLPNQDPAFGYGIQPLFDVNPDSALDQVATLGMNWVKVEVSWDVIQPAAETFEWASLDRIISASSARNLRILATIANSPDWARSVTVKGKHGPPDNVQAYVGFVSKVIQRYRGAISAVEIWNGQNLDDQWYTAGGLNPSGYLGLLVPTSQAIRQIDPGIIIVSGALTPTGRNDGVVAIDDFVYTQQLIDGGLLDYVDCLGVHHSGFNLPPTISAEDAFSGGMPRGTFFAGPYDTSNPANPHHSWAFYSTLNGYHNLIVAAHKETPLCVTEFGWASAEGYGVLPAGFEFAHDNTVEEQGRYIVKAFQSMRNWGFVRFAVLYNLDFSESTNQQTVGAAFFSLLGRDGRPRPAFYAVQNMPKPP